MVKVFHIQLLSTGLYLFIAFAESIVVGISHSPNGWVDSSMTYYFQLFQNMTLSSLSALYTLSMFETLIIANIMLIYHSRGVEGKSPN
jgi:hypothetical protein